jgi:hypothetical protein
MTDLGNGLIAGQQAAVPTPSCIRPRRTQAQQPAPAASASAVLGSGPAASALTLSSGPAIALARGVSGRVAARQALEAELAGVELEGRDRQFLGRLVHWDKRNAASVLSLLRRARQAGREESALTPRQLEIVLAALGDAARYRTSGVATTGCFDCEKIPSGRCADHARDNDRARTYAELALALSSGREHDGLPEPRVLSGYRRRRPVAS